MPGAFRVVAITTGAFTAISPSVNGYRINVREQGGATFPTTGLIIKKHVSGDELIIPYGNSYSFVASDGRRIFRPEAIRTIASETPAVEVVGYVKAADADCDIVIDEEGM